MNIKSSSFSVTKIELIYRNKGNPMERLLIEQSVNAFDIFLATWDMNRIELVEEFKIMLLDRRKGCIGISDIASGGMSSCAVDPKIVFGIALKAAASAIILAHNHPSGCLDTSKSDIALTSKLKQAGTFLDIQVADHLILSPRDYCSFADEGLMP